MNGFEKFISSLGTDEYQVAAVELYKLYGALISAGFTEEQSFRILLTTIIHNSKK